MGFRLPFAAGGSQTGPNWRNILSAVAVLTLATTGNAILPIPYAFAVAGAVAATLIIVFVALCNIYTCKLLLRASVATGASDYEHLAFAVGGWWARLWTEAWIVVLLIGTNIGAIIQMGEAFGYAVQSQWPDSPSWLWDRSGTAAMLFFTLVIIFPLSMLPRMRQLEMVGNCGVVILLGLAIIVMVKSISNGLPALASGDFPAVSSGDLTSISETFSLLCFAFYHQVMMMPLLAEMPRVSSEAARRSAKDLQRASAIVILGTSGLYYWLTGFFGAAMYGATDTSDNFLNNTWLPGCGTFILNLIVTIYLAISIPPIFHATNHTVDGWLRGLFPRGYGGLTRPWTQRFIVNCCTILTCLGVACGVPGESGTVLSVTGATGVFMCSYILPVAIHFALFTGKARCMRLPPSASSAGSLDGKGVTAADLAAEVESGSGASPAMPVAPLDGSEDATAAYAAGAGGVANIATGTGAGAGEEEEVAVGDGKMAIIPGSPLAGKHEPDPDAPPGLMFAYWKRRHPAMLLGYDIVLPVLVVALGCFFSVTTLALTF